MAFQSIMGMIADKFLSASPVNNDYDSFATGIYDEDGFLSETYVKDSTRIQLLVTRLEEKLIKSQSEEMRDEVAAVLLQDIQSTNDPDAQFALAARYHSNQNYAVALKYYMLAALQMHSPSINNIGVLINQGKGTIRDESFALKWFKFASSLGNVRATLNYAMVRTLPTNPDKNMDRKEGFELLLGLKEKFESKGTSYLRSARNRLFLRTVYNNLGCMYCRGMGTVLDTEKAKQMFLKAAELDSAVAKYNIGAMYLNGLGCEVNTNMANVWFTESREDRTHPDVPVIEAATDSSKLLMVTTLATN